MTAPAHETVARRDEGGQRASRRQTRFPPEGWTTRRIFVGVIIAVGAAFLIGAVAGPGLVATNVDPRPWAAALSAVTYLAMVAVIGWIVWMALGRKR
jgi:hypothetical protein